MARSEKSAKTPARRAKSKATASATQSSLALRQDGNGRDPVSSSALRRAKRASGLEREEKRAVRKKKGETRTDFLRASRLSSASREGAAKKRKKTSCPLSRKKAALSSLATGRRASHLARKDREAGQGPATTRKTGEETSSKDGEDRASQDGEDRASKDGEETCSKDGEDRASKDGEEASSKDGEDISSKDRVSEEERKGGDVRARQKPEHAPQTLRRNGLPEFDEKHCMAASSRESLSSFSPSLPSFSSWFPTEEPPSACVPQESRLVRAGWASGREERCEDVLASRRGLPAKTRAGFDAPECTYSGAWCECWRDGGPSPPLLAPCVESGRFSACCRCDASRLDREGLCAQDGGAQALGVSHALAGCACVAAFCPVATRPTSPRPRRWGPFSESPTCGGESDSDEEFSGFKRLRILDVDARGGFGASGVITVIDQAAFQRSLADALLQRQLASLPRPDWGGASDARPGKLRKTLAETVPRKAAESARETGSAALRADLPTSSPFAAAGPPRSPSRAAEKTSTHRQALRHRPGSGRAVAVSPSCHGTGESPLQSPDQDQGSRNDASLAPSVRESASSLCSSSLSHDSQSPKKIRSATGGEEGSRRDGAATEAERETRTDDQTATRNTGELCSESVEGEGNRPSSRHLSSRRWFPSPARLNAQQRTLCEFLLRVAARRERLERAGRYLSSLPLPRVSLEALEQAQRRLAREEDGTRLHAASSSHPFSAVSVSGTDSLQRESQQSRQTNSTGSALSSTSRGDSAESPAHQISADSMESATSSSRPSSRPPRPSTSLPSPIPSPSSLPSSPLRSASLSSSVPSSPLPSSSVAASSLSSPLHALPPLSNEATSCVWHGAHASSSSASSGELETRVPSPFKTEEPSDEWRRSVSSCSTSVSSFDPERDRTKSSESSACFSEKGKSSSSCSLSSSSLSHTGLGDDVHAAVSEADKVTGEGRKRGDKGEKRNRQREEGDSLVGAGETHETDGRVCCGGRCAERRSVRNPVARSRTLFEDFLRSFGRTQRAAELARWRDVEDSFAWLRSG